MEIMAKFWKHSDSIWNVRKLSDKKAVSCSDDKIIKVWDIDEGICLKTLDDHTNSVYSLDLSDL